MHDLSAPLSICVVLQKSFDATIAKQGREGGEYEGTLKCFSNLTDLGTQDLNQGIFEGGGFQKTQFLRALPFLRTQFQTPDTQRALRAGFLEINPF